MKKITQQSVGIDIAKDSFSSCICKKDEKMFLKFSIVKTFQNNKTGFNQLVKWARTQTEKGVDLIYTMEATGVYYESLAYHLDKLKLKVHVALPNKINHYAKSLNIKTKTDLQDSRVIAQFSVERKLSHWTPPNKILIYLRNLTRNYEQLQGQKTAFSNMLHCKEYSHEVQPFVLKSNKAIILAIEKQLYKCEEEIKKLVTSEAWLAEKFKKLCTIKGVGFMTTAVVVAETLGFSQFNNKKQLVSYAGYDVVERQFGTSIKGKTRISKKGNSHLRRALHFPALSAVSHSEHFKGIFNRIYEKNGRKMVGYVAIQRRLLTLMFTLWKNDTKYIENYVQDKKLNCCDPKVIQESKVLTGLKEKTCIKNYEQVKKIAPCFQEATRDSHQMTSLKVATS